MVFNSFDKRVSCKVYFGKRSATSYVRRGAFLKIIIFGTGGFLGSHALKGMIDLGHDTIPLSYRPKHDNEFIVHLENIVRSFNPDAIINAGACQSSMDDPEAMRDLSFSNILLPSYLAWTINNFAPKCLLVTFGSSWQYLNNKQEPYNAYAATKTAAESILEHYALDGLRSVNLQMYDTYGPKDKRNKIVNLIADALIHEEVLNMSSGEQLIDLIHINDVILAIVCAIKVLGDSDNGCVMKYSVRSGKPLSIINLAKLMAQIRGLDYKEMFNLGFYPYHKRERFELNSQLEFVPGWTPKKKLSDGLAELISSRQKEILK